jgi:4-amino-4-deoxy-L-arabinose transferase-like glycosyltransferase
VDWVNHRRPVNAIGAALGLALGFCTKGHIAVFTPAVGVFFYILYKKDWKSFYHPQLIVLLLSFALFISPVVYCYYLQYDLHPEKIIRGKSGRSGVAFILWKQNFERFQGDSFGADAKNDYLFFFSFFPLGICTMEHTCVYCVFYTIEKYCQPALRVANAGNICCLCVDDQFFRV